MSRSTVLVVFIDAFGPDQLDRFNDFFDFLPYRKSLHGILGYSSGALPTILTGQTPDVHGRMCLFSARKEGETSILRPMKWLGLLPKVLHERSKVRRVAEGILKKTAKLEGYVALHKVPPELFEWLDMPEREDMFTADEIGGAPTFLAEARKAGLSVYSAPWQLPEAERWEHSFKAIREQKPDLAFLYATALDGIMHMEGPNGSKAPDAAEAIAKNIKLARELMANDGSDLITMVIGDHGMAEVNKVHDPRKMLTRIGNVKVFVDSTMIRAWGTDAELSLVRKEIEKENWGGTWLQDDELQKRKVPNDNIFGRAIYVLGEGSLFAPSFLGGKISGMHGYDSCCNCAMAAIASDQIIPLSVRGINDLSGSIKVRLGI